MVIVSENTVCSGNSQINKEIACTGASCCAQDSCMQEATVLMQPTKKTVASLKGKRKCE